MMTPDERPGKLVFGENPDRKRSPSLKPENQDVFGIYKMLPAVKRVILEDARRWKEQSKERRQQQQEMIREVFGTEVEIPRYISPSTASNCLRWVGYEALEEKLGVKPILPTIEANLAMMTGNAAHNSLLRKIEQMFPSRQEAAFTIDEADLSGRVDMIIRNPQTGKTQVLELKFVSDFGFKKVNRDNLPDYLRVTPGVCFPQIEHYKQVILYLWSLEKRGIDVSCANIIYFNRNSGESKEALIMWDEISRFDAEKLVEDIKLAKACIDKGELPKPSVESPHVCGSFCSYRTYCDHGAGFAAGHEKKAAHNKRPAYVYRRAKEEREKKRQKMIQLGVVQPGLPLGEEIIWESRNVVVKKPAAVSEKIGGLRCGDCGREMKLVKNRKGKGGRYFCESCGD